MVGRILMVVLIGGTVMWGAVALLRLVFRASVPPNLFESPTLTVGKAYRYRIPLGDCAEPIVSVNSQNWAPDRPWTPPFPKNWHITSEGSNYHVERYLIGTVRAEPRRLVIGLPDGTVVRYYHPTTQRMALCA